MIVNSHYVPLQPPYPIIYCNGEMGMQTGTLIVVEGRDPSQPDPYGNRQSIYAIRTHSHPVVSYANKAQSVLTPFPVPNEASEGIVWDRVEMRDVTVLCYVNGVMSELLPNRIECLIVEERQKDAANGKHTFELSNLLSQFHRFSIRSSLYDEFDKIDSGDWVTLSITKALYGDFYYIDGSDEVPFLYVAENSNESLDEMEQGICRQIDDYRAAIAPRKLHFSFNSEEENLKPLCEKLNEKYSPF